MDSLWQQVYRLLAEVTILRKRLILKRCNDYLGIDFTPSDNTPDMFACAETVTTLLKSCGVFSQVVTGTWTLNQRLERGREKGWVQTTNPQPGDIIISPTGMRRNTATSIKNGHVGIVGNNGLIYSNDSYTGKWMTHYTLDSWHTRYAKIGTYPVIYYTYVSTF